MPAPPVFRYRRRPPNILPVDPKTGGLPRMVGWQLEGANPTTPGAPPVYLASGDGFIVYDPNLQTLSTQSQAGNGAILRVTPGTQMTFGVTLTNTHDLQFGFAWYGSNGLLIDASFITAGDLYANMTTRSSVTATVPANAMLLQLRFEYGYAWTTAGVRVADPVLVLGASDPGPLPPMPDPMLVGDRLYQSLPEMYRTADQTAAGPGQTPLPLYQLLHAIGEQADWPLYYADRMTARELTNPDLADDAWIPWLAQAAGITQSTSTTAVADMRAGIAGKQQAAQPGTPAAIVALVRTWLTGTKVCNIVPTSTPWTIAVQVRADEMNGMTSAQLKARILATGLVPAGFTLNISNALPTWDQVDNAFGPTWDDEDKNFPLWQDIDSYGVT